jgi:hypothetical protein
MNPETESEVQTESEPREPSWSRLVDRVRAGDPPAWSSYTPCSSRESGSSCGGNWGLRT